MQNIISKGKKRKNIFGNKKFLHSFFPKVKLLL